MTAFADAADTLYADDNLATDAVYRVGGLGAGVTVRVIPVRRRKESAFGDTGAIVYEIGASVRVSEIAEPRRGDTLDIASPSGLAGSFIVKSVTLDGKGLQSRLELAINE